MDSENLVAGIKTEIANQLIGLPTFSTPVKRLIETTVRLPSGAVVENNVVHKINSLRNCQTPQIVGLNKTIFIILLCVQLIFVPQITCLSVCPTLGLVHGMLYIPGVVARYFLFSLFFDVFLMAFSIFMLVYTFIK